MSSWNTIPTHRFPVMDVSVAVRSDLPDHDPVMVEPFARDRGTAPSDHEPADELDRSVRVPATHFDRYLDPPNVTMCE